MTDPQKDKIEKVCLTRGSIGSMSSFIGDMSFGLEIKQETNLNNFMYHDQFFDTHIHKEDQQGQGYLDDLDQDKNRISEENQLLLFQKVSEISRNSRGATNLICRLPQGKNSDQILLQLGDQFNDNFQFQQFCEVINNSNRNSNRGFQNIRISTETNPDGSLEIVMEWTDKPIDPNELQEMIDKLSLVEPIQYKPDRLSLLPLKVQIQGCICKKTKCLKLYCQCFQAGKICSEHCYCIECCNDDTHEQERQLAIQLLIEKNPNAFKDFSKSEEEIQHVTKHCNCKKTKCLKKYCECFNSGQTCGPSCNCDNCLNIKIPKDQLLHNDLDKSTLNTELLVEGNYHEPHKIFKT